MSTGFQGNIAKLEIGEKQIKNVEVKKKRFEEIKLELTKEKTTLDGDITKLRDGLSKNTTIQSVDQKTGQLVTRANNANRKSFESQLKDAQTRRDTISKKIDAFNDSITNLDVKILDMQSQEISGSELGAIKYISELLDWNVKRTANLFILILIFVFDPLAITLVIATNQAFKSVNNKNKPKTHWQKEAERVWADVARRKAKGEISEPTEEELADEPTALANSGYRERAEMESFEDVTDQVPTNYRPSTDEVEVPEVYNKTREEENQVVNENIKRLIYKK